MYDIIKKKRDGAELDEKEIRYFCEGYVRGEIPDYQVSALLMAIYFKGMTVKETVALTFAIRDSGDKTAFNGIKGLRADKHSTGGVGDKTSLIVAPAVASLGLKVAKISGRGLGHTGGTVDKLESIPGYDTAISGKRFENIVNETGVAIIGQSGNIAPADKLLYALRDVTATVDSIPLIASSIMGKKLCADDDIIVLDVKTGSGAFMKTKEESVALASLMVDIGKNAGKKISALITDMDVPLGNAIGNSLEVAEAVKTLKGQGPRDLYEVCRALCAEMLFLADKGTRSECEKLFDDAISSGKALKTFAEMVKAQGGDDGYILGKKEFPKAKYEYDVKSVKDGYISVSNAEDYGRASLILGAGRNTAKDEIDFSAGIVLKKKYGDEIKKGEVIATLYSNKPDAFEEASELIIKSMQIVDKKPLPRKLILDTI